MPTIYRTCVQCDSDFYIKDKDQEYFQSNNLELPKRCWACRQRNRETIRKEIEQQKEQDRRAAFAGGVVDVFVPDKRYGRNR